MLLITAIHGVQSSKLELVPYAQESAESLQNDFREFMEIIPVESIHNLTEFFYENDAAMRASYCYLRDDAFPKILENLARLSLVTKFRSFLNDSGVNIADLGKRIEKIVLTKEEAETLVGNCSGLIDSVVAGGANLISPCFFPQLVNEEQSDDMGGMNAFFSEALSLIPQDEVLTLFFAKMEQSNAFSSFLEKLNASDYENLTESLKVKKN